jgi:hypothetical protein
MTDLIALNKLVASTDNVRKPALPMASKHWPRRLRRSRQEDLSRQIRRHRGTEAASGAVLAGPKGQKPR